MQDITLKRPAIKKTAETPPRPASRNARVGAIVGVIALAALVDLLRLGAPSVWMDEAASIQLARLPLHTLYAAYSGGSEPNMILYYLALHGWLALGAVLHIPPTEAYIRLPSALFAVLASVVVYLLGRRFFGQFAALAAVLIFTVNGWQLTYAQEARSYSLQLLLVSLTWLGLFSALRPRRLDWRWWSVFVGAGALSVYAQAFSALTLVALAVACGLLLIWPTTWRARVRRALPALVIGFIAIGVLIAPFAYVSRGGSKTGWIPAPTLSALLAHAAALDKKNGLALALALAFALLLALAAVALCLPWARPLRARLLRRDGGALAGDAAPIALALACWLVIPVVISYVVSLGSVRIFSGRYLVVVLPALSLLVGAGLARIPWRVPRLGLAVGVALALIAVAPLYYARAQVEDWRDPTRWLEQRYQPGDGLVAYNNAQDCELPIDYYLWLDGSQARVAPDSPGALHVDPNRYGNPSADYSQALNPAALAVFAAHHPRIFFIAGRLTDDADVARVNATESWLDAHYRFVGQTTSGIVTIRLYDTTP